MMLLVVGHEDALDLDLDAVHHRRSRTRAKKATGFFYRVFFRFDDSMGENSQVSVD